MSIPDNSHDRLANYSMEVGGLYADYTRHLVTDEILAELQALAEEAGVADALQAMMTGEAINQSEGRAVLHTAMRAAPDRLEHALAQQVEEQRRRLAEVSNAIRSGAWLGATGKAITNVVNIGIGGSDLGPKMVCAALREYAHPDVQVHFISNVDGAEILHLLGRLDPETTLFIISSKSFTTSETLRNAATGLAWLAQGLGLESPAASNHVLGVTANPDKALAYGLAAERILTFDASIGGRYSLWSSVGLPIAISVGYDRYLELLDGAAIMDRHFTDKGKDSLPVILGMLGVWYNNFLGLRSQAVVPYCERLGLLVNHLQQVAMESNGKSATQTGAAVNIDTGQIVWGQTGTSGQHAFFQLLHQGTQIVPVDFIGACQDSASKPEHQRELNANMIAQADALTTGKPSAGHQHYPGNRPSTILLLDKLNPQSLGLLIALYEHQVFVQGI
ncbi:MAG: glucose-6-phosphate isomerase, partial [Pseudomonadales bacterium]